MFTYFKSLEKSIIHEIITIATGKLKISSKNIIKDLSLFIFIASRNRKCQNQYTILGYFLLYQCGIIMSRGVFMRLKEIRKSKGISQLKLALDLNTSQNTISRYETGEREPSITELKKIADYFGISVDYLLERTNNPKINTQE